MSDVLARAAEVLGAHQPTGRTSDEHPWKTQCSCGAWYYLRANHEAEMLADAGLLADTGWWEGVNDQWKHRPIGNRLVESANPYRGGEPR